MKKMEVHGRRRLLDDFFQIDEVTLSHQLLDEGRIDDAKPLIALMWLRARRAVAEPELLCSGPDSFDIIP